MMSESTPLARMHSPPHPGELVREDVLKEYRLSVTDGARLLAVSRSNLSLFVNERIDLSPEMALRLEAAFGLEADMLMALQTDHDMAKARTRQAEITAHVRPFVKPEQA